MMRKYTKGVLGQGLKIVFTLAILVYLIKNDQIDFQKIGSAFSHFYWLILAVSMEGLAIFITALRWRMILGCQGIQVSVWRGLRLHLIGSFFSVLIPGMVSGDVVKIYYVARNENNKMGAGLSVIMDRLVGLVSLFLIAFGATLFNYSFLQSIPELKILSQWIIGGIGLFLVGICIMLLVRRDFVLSERWPLFLRRLVDVFLVYRKHLDKLLIGIILTSIGFLATVIVFYSVVRALGENSLPFSLYFFLLPLGLFVMALPITPAGLGVGQGVFLKLFEWAYGKPITVGADVITLVQMIFVCWALIGLVAYLLNNEKAPQNLAPVALPGTLPGTLYEQS